MNFSIIAVGNEVLSGTITNTTTPWLVSTLISQGFSPNLTVVVPDKKDAISSAIEMAWDNSDMIVLTGGLGPTPDDLTKNATAEFLKIPMIFSKDIENRIKDFFQNRKIEMSKSNINQAYIPEGSEILQNSYGTAPGIKIIKNGKTIILLPGPPRELEPMWNTHILPTLKTDAKNFHKDFYVLGLPESKMTDILGEILNTNNSVSVAPYASLGEIRLRVSTSAKNIDNFSKKTDETVTQIQKLLTGHIFPNPTPQTLIHILKEKNYTISTAESCTGGLIAKTLTDVSGVSDIFMGGAATYSNQAKIDILGVSEDSLKNHGAVSEQVAKEMALGAKKAYKTDVAVSTTGIAGPTGGTTEKPVGLVYMAIATQKNTTVFKRVFSGTRADVRHRTLMKVLWESIKILS